MCGIAGVWHTDGKPIDVTAIHCASEAIRHRGPDDDGFLFMDADANRVTLDSANLAFAFRRLSILDLSPAGHQPMCSADGALWIIFNGEIYNYVELRDELRAHGHQFRTQTDTEVILAAYAEWGEACVQRFNGMWALALWDARQRRLFCSRDRFGIKPFYYSWDGVTFAFASEIKALLRLPGVPRRVNDARLFDYLTFGYLDHSPATCFAEIYQLPPAHNLTVQGAQMTIKHYWQLDPERRVHLASDSTYADEFYALFEDAVRLHLRSDVAIGTCLSGGLDSSSIVCVANKLLFADGVLQPELVGAQQKTFSSCFDDPRFDERRHIRPVLETTGAEANYIFPSPEKLQADLNRLIWHQDEPFGSTSIFAQWCVMERVRERGVKVLLDGQGADELLAGYTPYYRYRWAALAQAGRWRELQSELSAYRNLYGASMLRQGLGILRPLVPESWVQFARRFRRNGATLGLTGVHPDFWREHRQRVPGFPSFTTDTFDNYLHHAFTYSSLPALLHYEDRNSMAHSVEARVPFLDYRLVEFIFALPPEQKLHQALTKVVLRNAMRGVLPEPVRMRTDKMGFVTPERVWFSNELNVWLLELFRSNSFRQRGYFDVQTISRLLDEHRAGKRDLTFVGWRWANLELWLRMFIDGDALP